MSTTLSGPSSCTFCTRSIHHSFHIQCAECNDVYLCVDCFSAGVNIGNHENHHSYRIPDCLDNPIFAKDWTIKEELLLLEGIQKHGPGNWKTIAEFLKTNKTTKAVEDHYWELYMGRHGCCLPLQCLVNGEVVETASYFPKEVFTDEEGIERIDENDFYHIPCNAHYQRDELVQRDLPTSTSAGGGVTPSGTSAVTPSSGPEREGREKEKEGAVASAMIKSKDRNDILAKISLLPGADLPGYMPLREDFEIEYENDAEMMLADMEFGYDDHPSEIELKLQVIRIYNIKLNERDRRKRFVIDRGLIDVKAQQAVSSLVFFLFVCALIVAFFFLF
jgi:transcriptional adapter 2-alpha